MADIILVRHGQANSHAADEESYDRLSDLGHDQARWLGAHFKDTNPHFDRVITGTLSRQIDTARSAGFTPDATDPRLNELSYFALAQAVEAQFGLPAPADAREFARYLPQVVSHWAEDRLNEVPETFQSFHTRVETLTRELCEEGGRSLIVTSGGVIGMILRQVLRLETEAMAAVMLQVMNSSIHRLHFVHGRLMLATFNATPHLDPPERAHARTFI
ncbi:histidine phosphatase family protein [Roseovarius sp. SCSIO 43702]|uniref:histidine phosphatase family protein n=1 Tax=Roseovarius sp. SCSIO 43702 TaxID=2823043 RepID=UPI001C739594|nr:histidine phosphatase family protein [Roseovarius sp. SCSIO 43702]QYX57265.1 histidine phosphatase family protein [Roseovarius sp. SCSIO 43702]